MTADAIKLVSEALRARLKLAIGRDVFVGPLDDKGAADMEAVLFLYRVAVNADLRNAEHRLQPVNEDDPPTVHEGGLPLDLYYLFTARTLNDGNESTALGVLGRAMQALNDDPLLTGSLVHGETVRLSLDPVGSEEMSRIWSLFPTANYRTSVIYLASPVWIDPATPRVPAVPVTNERYRSAPIAS